MKRSLVIWAFLATFLAALPAAHAQSAAHWFKQGQAAEAKDDMEAAYEAYYQAYQKKPSDERYKLSWERTRFPAAAMHVEHGEKLRAQGDYRPRRPKMRPEPPTKIWSSPPPSSSSPFPTSR